MSGRGVGRREFAIGRIERVERAGSGVKTAFLRPAVDFSALEEVLVVLGPPPTAQAPQAMTSLGAGSAA